MGICRTTLLLSPLNTIRKLSLPLLCTQRLPSPSIPFENRKQALLPWVSLLLRKNRSRRPSPAIVSSPVTGRRRGGSKNPLECAVLLQHVSTHNPSRLAAGLTTPVAAAHPHRLSGLKPSPVTTLSCSSSLIQAHWERTSNWQGNSRILAVTSLAISSAGWQPPSGLLNVGR